MHRNDARKESNPHMCTPLQFFFFAVARSDSSRLG